MDKFDTAALNNPDGFGYAYVLNGQVFIRKSAQYDKLRTRFERDYNRYREQSPFLIHFRWATHGDTVRRLAHPFRMQDGGAVIHNGVLDMPVIPSTESDTTAFVHKVIDRLPRGWSDTKTWPTMVQEMAGYGNKLAFLWPDSTFLILNEKAGHWDGDNWFSNQSYKYKRVTQTEYDYSANWRQNYSVNGTGTKVYHPIGCVCDAPDCDGDDGWGELDEPGLQAYNSWVAQSRTMQAEKLGGKGSKWHVEPGNEKSYDPLLVIATGGEGGLLPSGYYVYDKGSIYPCPKDMTSEAEVWAWFKTHRAQRALVSYTQRFGQTVPA